MTDPVTFSEKAIQEIKKIILEKKLSSEYGLRVAMGGGGCGGGAEPIIGFDKVKETDRVYSVDGITIMVDKKHFMHLFGKKVEFYEVDDLSGFHFVD